MIRDETALKVAEFLLQIKAIKLNLSEPFTWSSGWKSPIYCDNRITLSYPRIRTYLRQHLVKAIEDNFGKPEVIAGVATAGIAHGVLVAEAMGVPFVYVRPQSKEHGTGNLIEGELKPSQTVVVIEDLISTGQSSIKVVEAVRQAGCDVKGLAAIFNYGFKSAADTFKKAKCNTNSLCNYDVLLHQAVEKNYVTDKDLKTLKAWRDNPQDWDGQHK